LIDAAIDVESVSVYFLTESTQISIRSSAPEMVAGACTRTGLADVVDPL
jgi:hypothetical protein